jgi:uncharacterized protein (TIGR03437 family)
VWVIVDADNQLAGQNTANDRIAVPVTVTGAGALPGPFMLSNEALVCDTAPPVGPAVRLKWTMSSGATSYDVYRNGSLIASAIIGSAYYDSAGLNTASSYTYFIRARNSAGTRDSNTVTVNVPADICASSTPPGPFTLSHDLPVCDSAPPVGPAVRLNWTVSSGATTYDVYRNGALITPGINGNAFYNSQGLSAGTSYTYFIRARNSTGTRDSNTITVHIPADVCTPSRPPGSPAVTATPACFAGDSSGRWQPAIKLVWTAAEMAWEYDIYRDGSLLHSKIPANVRSLMDSSGIVAGASYSYVVVAKNSNGNSPSAPVTVAATQSCSPPTAPVLSGTSSCSSGTPYVNLTWTGSMNVTAYNLYRNGILVAQGLPPADQAFRDNVGLLSGVRYNYTLSAVNTYGSTYSNNFPILAATCTDPRTNEADVSVEAAFTPSPVQRNTDVTLTLTIRNTGPDLARDVVLTVPTPPGSAFRSATWAAGHLSDSQAVVSTIRIALGALPPYATTTVSLLFYVHAEAGTTLTTAATVAAATQDRRPSNNSSRASVPVTGAVSQNSVEQFINHVEALLRRPFPEFRGNWLADILQKPFGKTAYEKLYLDGVNARNTAANLLAAAKRFYLSNQQDKAYKYAELALSWIQTSDQAFSLAVDVYYRPLEKVQDAAQIPHMLGMSALYVLGATTKCSYFCIGLAHVLEFGVDRALEGTEQAIKNRISAIVVDQVLKIVGINSDDLIRASNQWIGQSGLYERLAQATKNPELSKQLMTVVAGALNVSLDQAQGLVAKLLSSLADLLSAPLYIEPAPPASTGGNPRLTVAGALGSAGWPVPSATTESVSWPTIHSTGVVNGASYLGGGVAPGEIVTLFGNDIGPETLTPFASSADGRIGSSLAGVRVLFDGVAAPLLYVSRTQIGAIVPYAVSGQSSTRVQVEYAGVRSFPVELPVVAANPAIFSLEMSGRGPGAILNEDGSVNSAANPAEKGSVVSIYATGEGQTDPWGVDGRVAGDRPPKPLLPVSITIGGVPAEIQYAGGAPTLVAGVIQINAVVPSNVASGPSIPVVLTIGEASSQEEITMAIR